MTMSEQTVRDLLRDVALERGLRRSTYLHYQRLLTRLDLLDREVGEVVQGDVVGSLCGIDSPNTRRAAVICLRSVFGWSIKIPRGIPRRYDLPDEDTPRLALMTTPHEPRGLLMMYAGLRIGEACAITLSDVAGDRLRVDKQVQQLHETRKPTTTKIGPFKSGVAEVVIPQFLTKVVLSLGTAAKPDGVRESLRGRYQGRREPQPHMLRHWYATTMVKRGVPLSVVSEQMRHSDIATTPRTYSQANTSTTIHDTFG